MGPTTIDLFAGAGGITEGFRQAGFRCLFANDFAQEAVETFRYNHPDVEAEHEDIAVLDPQKIRRKLKLQKGQLGVLVGGPPCQGFSINAPERFVEDPRNAMFRHYLRFLDEFAPSAFLFENVPGMLSLANGRIYEKIVSEFEGRGYRISTKILLSANYGVPQVRWRLIILGSRGKKAPTHPEPTHYYSQRANFRGGATIAVRPLPIDEFHLRPAVTIGDAIRDLPELRISEGEEIAEYDKPAHSAYAKIMRQGCEKLFNHTANNLSTQNLERLRHVKPGGAWTDIPHELLPAGMQRARRSDHTKRYGRPSWDSLSGTVMTKCDPHWGAVFHPEQERTFTPREAARFQSFPDSYRFLGPRASQYEQIGNAVPVLMARAIAESLRDTVLQKKEKGSKSCR